MHIHVVANPTKPESIKLADSLCQLVAHADATASMEAALYERLADETKLLARLCLTVRAMPRHTDVCLALGGDGTMLEAQSLAAPLGVACLGVNLGRVGFLMHVDPARADEALQKVLAGDYQVSERMILAVTIDGGAERLAINDVSLTRGACPNSLEVAIYVDGDFLYAPRGDGVLVSSPIGSTGYALSAGGPVMTPQMHAMSITPLVSHRPGHVPIVLPETSCITLKVRARQLRQHSVVLDGWSAGQFSGDTEVVIKAAPYPARFVSLGQESFFDRLRRMQCLESERGDM